MASKYQIIARYTDGIPKFWIGKKVDPEKPLDEGNIEWKMVDGSPLRFDQYQDAHAYVENRSA